MTASAWYLARVELVVGVRQAAELPGAPVQVDVARTEGREEAHLGLGRAHWGAHKHRRFNRCSNSQSNMLTEFKDSTDCVIHNSFRPGS